MVIIMSNKKKRLDLIKKIQENRKSKVITYITGDRANLETQIDESHIRYIYDHIKDFSRSKKPKIDLFLYSRGGSVEVPWKLVSMIRECASSFSVLIPYRAHSAATMISLGADSIVMGRKGELGPIDPILNKRIDVPGKPSVNIITPVEDILSYVDFLKVRAGISDQDALAKSIVELPKQIDPWTIGGVYRIHEHINLVAKKLLESVNEKKTESQIGQIIEVLVEKTYLHGHAIGRDEAKKLGLPIVFPKDDLENDIWKLFELYEEELKLKDGFDIDGALGDEDKYIQDNNKLAFIESTLMTNTLLGKVRINRQRQNHNNGVQVNISLNLPAGVQLSPQDQQGLRSLLQQLQQEAQRQTVEQIRQQSTVVGIGKFITGLHWDRS